MLRVSCRYSKTLSKYLLVPIIIVYQSKTSYCSLCSSSAHTSPSSYRFPWWGSPQGCSVLTTQDLQDSQAGCISDWFRQWQSTGERLGSPVSFHQSNIPDYSYRIWSAPCPRSPRLSWLDYPEILRVIFGKVTMSLKLYVVTPIILQSRNASLQVFCSVTNL